MKKIFILAVLAFGIINFGCEECEENTDEYYIKYYAEAETGVGAFEIDITYKNEYGEIETIYTTKPSGLRITLGPVEEGFTASVSIATRREISNTTLKANIQVSKNDGPFAEKASGESDDLSEPLEIEYTIDF